MNTRNLSFPAPISLLLLAALPAQNWTLAAPATSPAAAVFPRLVHDLQRARSVAFGGWNGVAAAPVVFQDTWEHDGVTWSLRTPATVPTERDSHVMAFDLQRGRTVMFGGWDFNLVFLGQTWEWDGTDWSNRNPVNAPSPRILSAMAYDITRGVCVLFGGEDGSGLVADTWEWDGTDWTQRTTAVAPSARTSHAMTYDAVRGRIVLFGGDDGNAQLGDTWEYDGIAWSQVLTDGAPPARVDAQLAFDTQRGRSLLFGGSDTVIDRNDTWEYDGSRWQQVFTLVRPQGNAAMGMAYDSGRGRTIVFGGYDGLGAIGDTWEFGGVGATVRTFGTGCVGGAGRTPRLSPVVVPGLGTTTRVDLVDLPAAGGAAYLAIGASDQSWLGAPLPVDLSPIGLVGCRGYTSADAGQLLSHAAGTATWTFAIPGSPSLGGFVFYLQALSFDPAAPRPFAAALSNAARLEVR